MTSTENGVFVNNERTSSSRDSMSLEGDMHLKRSTISTKNLALLEQVTRDERINLKDYGHFIGCDEDENDYQWELDLLKQMDEEDLQKKWKLFGRVGVQLARGKRLEYASWRIWGQHSKPDTIQTDSVTTPIELSTLAALNIDIDNILGLTQVVSETLKGADEKAETESVSTEFLETSDGLAHISHIDFNRIEDETLQQILDMIHDEDFDSTILPQSVSEFKHAVSLSHRKQQRPTCAIFVHSMQRNGANNFALYLIRKLRSGQSFHVFTPKTGPMTEDFETVGATVQILDPCTEDYELELSKRLRESHVGFVVCNTMMTCNVLPIVQQIRLPSLWVLHESWPINQFENYTTKVFLVPYITSETIKAGFKSASHIAVPSMMQHKLYKPLFSCPVNTIYNGIPLRALNAYRLSNSRENIRRDLGYGPEDVVLLHLGTVCARKGQLITAKAFSRACDLFGCDKAKLLMVGARYIRDHEIQYINQVKAVIDRCHLTSRFQLLDVQSFVLPYYLAADIVLVPSLNEVLPLVIGEAMAFERPVIATRVDAIPESITDGVEGVLVEPGDDNELAEAISVLYHDKDTCIAMGKAGRKRVLRQFSYDTMGKQYRRVMDDTFVQHPTFRKEARELNLKGKVVLVDLNNTIANWDAEFVRVWRNHGYPEEHVEIIKHRKLYHIEQNFPEQLRGDIASVIRDSDFTSHLTPYPGAVNALKEMVLSGIDVRIVSTPHLTCPGEDAMHKYKWVEAQLGAEFVHRIVIASDKTHVYGDLIVDDRPQIVGTSKPVWRHVLMDQPYNRQIIHKRRLLHWNMWRAVLGSVLQGMC